MFLNSEALLKLHTDMAEAMTAAPDKISQVFIQERERLLAYASYCARLGEAQELVTQLMRRKDIGAALKDLQQASQQKFPLKDLLRWVRMGVTVWWQFSRFPITVGSVPMQRILKYPLLLKELVKRESNDVQTANLNEALRLIMVRWVCALEDSVLQRAFFSI